MIVHLTSLFIQGNCSQGFYCPRGETIQTAHPCPIGHYCVEHTYEPMLCPSGWYQDVIGQWTCKLCPAGYYCDNSYGIVVINDTVKCPPGYFCPEGVVIILFVNPVSSCYTYCNFECVTHAKFLKFCMFYISL